MANESSRLPIWARPEPGARKPRFSREQLGRTAVAIADAEGFEATSMRRLAAELDAGTMTLYHYVRDKEDLIALMDDALMSEIILKDGELPEHWHPAMCAIARRTREVLLAHPWALLSLRGAPPGPNGIRHTEQSLAALRNTPLTAAQKLELVALVDDYVFGHLLRTAELDDSAATSSEETYKAMWQFSQKLLQSGDFPELSALLGNPGPTDDGEAAKAAFQSTIGGNEARFEHGLQILLEGASRSYQLPPPTASNAATRKPARAPRRPRKR